MKDGSGEWQAIERGLPEAPAVRALAVHPQKPEIIYAGTQAGAYRSADRGEHWEKVVMPTTDCRCGRFCSTRTIRHHPGWDGELRDLPQRRCRRALGPAPGQRALSRDHHAPGAHRRSGC